MTMTARRCVGLLLAGACGGAGTPDESSAPPPAPSAVDVRVNGAVQKGPFVVGSAILIANLDTGLNPTGAVFTTSTRNDLGEFELEFDAAELISIQGSGFYYNEITESLSVGNVTLRALYGVGEAGEHDISVNVVTHLTFERIQKLMLGGATFDVARAQAELELQAALGIVSPSFAVGVDGVQMNILRGDSNGNAYLFAVSAVLAQAAQTTNAAAADAALQELLNQIALDLEQTGTIEASRRASIVAALGQLDTARVEAGLAARLSALGSTRGIPDLDRILDQDADGVSNTSDNCPRLANATQEDADADGRGDACNPLAVDLLFVIDNSLGMADKQQLLAAAVPELVSRLANPVCVDPSGGQFPPPPPGGACPEGQARELAPIGNVNVGVVSSSLGDAGANVACPPPGFPRYVPDRIDMAHLVGSLPRGRGAANTDEGFLAWRAGQTELEDYGRDAQQMVRDVGENGCGWEASLESWYRFLVDPYPYRELVRVMCPGSSSTGLNCVQPAVDEQNRIALDETLMAQRAAFLQPGSRLAIIVLSDENDCSIQVGNQTWVVAAIDDSRPMFRGSSTCDSDPNAKCCYSCPLGPPAGCASDAICAGDAALDVLQNRLPANQDGQDLRCYQQKRRFGIDFLYPTRRYVNALKNAEICWNDLELSSDGCAQEDLVPNPLYTDGRSPSRVFYGAIIGVPWQAIDSDVDASGRPLAAGQLRFSSATELEQSGTWDEILGSPGIAWRAGTSDRPEVAGTPAVPPRLPQMIESEFPRAGVGANPINGREYSTLENSNGTIDTPNDLQYACIFPLPQPRDCTQRDANTEACDCYQEAFDRPLCERTPGESAPGTTQYWGKAYPGGRHLEVLQGYGSNAIVASICPRNVADSEAPDFGYRPAVDAIIERLKEQLPAPSSP